MTDAPCPHCVRAAMHGHMRREAIQPLPPRPHAPLARADNTPCCHDCELADTLVAMRYVPDWDMARTAVSNTRQESLRLPGAPIGFIQMGLMRASEEGDLDRHHAWLKAVGIEDWY